MTALPLRLMKTLYAPGEVMDELKDEPRWFGALMVGGLLVAASAFLVPEDITMEMLRSQFLERGTPAPENLEGIVTMTRRIGLLGALVFWFIFAFTISGLSSVIFAFVMGDQGRYVQYLAVVSHALIISALGAVITLPLRIAARDLQLTLGLGTWAQTFMEDGYLLNVLHGMELFSIWTYAVVAVGVSCIDPRRSWLSAFIPLMTVALLFAMAFAFVR